MRMEITGTSSLAEKSSVALGSAWAAQSKQPRAGGLRWVLLSSVLPIFPLLLMLSVCSWKEFLQNNAAHDLYLLGNLISAPMLSLWLCSPVLSSRLICYSLEEKHGLQKTIMAV